MIRNPYVDMQMSVSSPQKVRGVALTPLGSVHRPLRLKEGPVWRFLQTQFYRLEPRPVNSFHFLHKPEEIVEEMVLKRLSRENE